MEVATELTAICPPTLDSWQTNNTVLFLKMTSLVIEKLIYIDSDVRAYRQPIEPNFRNTEIPTFRPQLTNSMWARQ